MGIGIIYTPRTSGIQQEMSSMWMINSANMGALSALSAQLNTVYDASLPLSPNNTKFVAVYSAAPTSSYALSATNITSNINMFEQLHASMSGSSKIDTDTATLFKYIDELDSNGRTTSATARKKIVEIRQLHDSYKNYSSVNPNASLAHQLSYDAISAENSASPMYTQGIII